jgi:hypothetical protein
MLRQSLVQVICSLLRVRATLPTAAMVLFLCRSSRLDPELHIPSSLAIAREVFNKPAIMT